MEFKVQPRKIKIVSSQFRNTLSAINFAKLSISKVISGLGDTSESYTEVLKYLKRIQEELSEAQKTSIAMKSALGSIATKYETTEKKLYLEGLKLGVGAGIAPELYRRVTWFPIGSILLSGTGIIGYPIGLGVIGLATGAFNASANYEIGAMRTESALKSNLSMYDEKGKFDPKAKLSAKAEIDALYAKAGYEVGSLSGDVEVKVGKAAIKGELGASLYDEAGNLDPSLEAKAKAEATALEGKVTTTLGDEDNNIHAEADGKLLTAEAEATASVSKDGVELGAKAGAYAATGSVKGGITIFGIKIDATMEGGAGGGSIEAKASATTTSVTAKVGAGLILGGGLEISIDWASKSSNALSHSASSNGGNGRGYNGGGGGKAFHGGGKGSFGSGGGGGAR